MMEIGNQGRIKDVPHQNSWPFLGGETLPVYQVLKRTPSSSGVKRGMDGVAPTESIYRGLRFQLALGSGLYASMKPLFDNRHVTG